MSVRVTTDNFARAESDLYFARAARDGGFGKLHHNREMTPLDQQSVVRMNRDTLYSAGVFDLDAAAVTITLPDPGTRFMSMLVISEDHYAIQCVYAPGRFTYSKDCVGTRYAMLAVRTLANPADRADLETAHRLQDAIGIEQAAPGRFESPAWDQTSQNAVRDALSQLASCLPPQHEFFGRKEDVNPLHHLIGTAVGWGGNPAADAVYLMVTPKANDGKTIQALTVKDVPVDGFWSISLYNDKGYFEKNDLDAYSINNLTAKANGDGSITVQFGGCGRGALNCLPIAPGWNYTIRLYRPRQEIIDRSWTFPEAQPVK